MTTIYIDSDFRCYTEPAEGRTAIETDVFDGKCKTYIEGYRFIPAGQTWTRGDGVEFSGEMVAPFVDSKVLEAAQGEYERELLAEALADRDAALTALTEMGVTI